MQLTLVISGYDEMEPIFSAGPVSSMEEAESEAEAYLNTSCEISVFGEDRENPIKVIQSKDDMLRAHCPCECVKCGKVIKNEELLSSIEINAKKLYWKGDAVSFDTFSNNCLLEFCVSCVKDINPKSFKVSVEDNQGRVFSVNGLDTF